MIKWKSWVAMMTLSLAVVGCAPAADQAGDSAYHGAGINGYRGLATDQTTNWNMNKTNGTLPFANANMNDQGTAFPGVYAKNSIYKDGNSGMGTLGANRSARDYGYATYTKRDMNPQQASTFFIDRNVLARAIATVVTSIPGVEKANVLVTDEDLVITLPGVTDEATLNKAKLSAWSMSPRYFKVYVTGDQQVIDQVDTLVNRSPQNLNRGQLDGILENNKMIDMTGTNVTDNGQNVTEYNLNQTYPNTNGTHRISNNR